MMDVRTAEEAFDDGLWDNVLDYRARPASSGVPSGMTPQEWADVPLPLPAVVPWQVPVRVPVGPNHTNTDVN